MARRQIQRQGHWNRQNGISLEGFDNISVVQMNDTLEGVGKTSSYPFRIVDIDECVQRQLTANNLDISTMRFHPPAAGHRAYAGCLAKLVLLPATSTRK